MRNRFTYIVFFVLSFLCTKGLCQNGQLQFTHVDIKEGLSHNQVNCVLRDEQGFIWFGTPSGLNRYDGYSFKVFRHELQDTTTLKDSYIEGIYPLPEGRLWINTRSGSDVYDPNTEAFMDDVGSYLQSLSLPEGTVNAVIKGKQHTFWFLYENRGIYGYSPTMAKPVHIQYRPNDPTSISNNRVSDIATGKSGNLWVIQSNGILEKLDEHTLKVVYRTDSLLLMNQGRNGPYKMFVDRQGDLWIYIFGNGRGLFYFDSEHQLFYHITKESDRYHLNNNIVDAVTQDSKGNIWVGTDHGGINLINKETGEVRYLKHNPEDDRSLSQNSIYSLYKDNSGIIWIGTYKKGVCYYKAAFNRFPLYSHNPNLPAGATLPYEDVNCFVEDREGNLWIGTNGGGLIFYNRQSNRFKQYKHFEDNANSLCNNVIVSLCMDTRGKLWIGTYMGGLDCYDGKTFTHYKHDPNDSTSLSNNSIWDIFEDDKGRLWLATLGGDLERFDSETKRFVHYKSKRVGANYVLDITVDSKNNLWIGTAVGLEVMNLKTGERVYYNHDPKDSTSLSNNNIISIFQDSRGWIWVGTRQGLNLFDPVTKTFRRLTAKNGLPDNTILTILEDKQHRLWLSTLGGLSCLTISGSSDQYTFSFKNYNESDGLQGREFNIKAALRTREGKLIFGGPNGFNMFDPGAIKRSKRIPPVVFTDLRVFNKRVSIGDTINKHIILPKAISKMKSIVVPYGANDFSIVFAALGYTHSGANKYAYKLKGFSNKWIESGDGMHKATYTNLDPGEYTFIVKTSNNDGVWGDDPATLQIEVLPPFWRTTWAYILYALVILGILYAARSILLYRARMNFRIEHQQLEAQRMHELDMMKIRFFTNISHELRTPLTLILTPLEKILKQDKEYANNQLKLIHRNAKRLLHLVNQLMDFRKIEVQEIKLRPTQGDIVHFIKDIVCSFTDIAEKKNIDFSLETSLQSIITDFDSYKLERIMFNLLSNAFKFTHEKGAIAVHLDVQKNETKDLTYLMISVKDNGIGIPEEKQQRIFERFFQHRQPASVANPGNGIGLAITSEFVRLHQGTIKVESTPGKGSCFTVQLPITSLNNNLQKKNTHTLSLNRENATPELPGRQKHKSTILLIDDNEDFRFYLKDNLSVYFNLIEAADGREGWIKSVESKPDLIVSDIMMPASPANGTEMNGIALSRKLKKDPRTAGIPVILLTGRATADQRLEGYETGANDYITKPFNFEILLARILNLLAEKKRQQKKQPPKVPIDPKEINITPEEEKFLQEVKAIVEKNMNSPDFSVEELSASLYMSRVTLYKRLSSITGKPPAAFIRLMRLKRAAQLLEKGNMKVAQVAYEVGFNNPKYFTKYFKAEFGILPSEFGKNQE